ncbi:hypothetical protein, partial [Phocaeicola plebeius]|uniref:hypothetical protein n=1 Tax=Phocaeicola plebeius TaxID=310297 RepID=UPI00402802C4
SNLERVTVFNGDVLVVKSEETRDAWDVMDGCKCKCIWHNMLFLRQRYVCVFNTEKTIMYYNVYLYKKYLYI